MSNKPQTTITKSITETYTLRGKHCLWAKINLDIGDKTVNVMISSDYGNFQYYWGSCGCNPKEFLTKIDMDYTMGKLMQGHDNKYEPDWEQRFIELKQNILEMRRCGDIGKQKAKDLWEYVTEDLKHKWHDFVYDENLYYHELINSKYFEDMFYDTESISSNTKIKRIVFEFWEDIWTPFTNYLKERIKYVNHHH